MCICASRDSRRIFKYFLYPPTREIFLLFIYIFLFFSCWTYLIEENYILQKYIVL